MNHILHMRVLRLRCKYNNRRKVRQFHCYFFKGVFPDHGGRTKCLKPQLIKWIYTTSQEMKAIDIMKLRSNRFCLLFVLDPIHDCSSAHFQCYSNQLWISKWFLVAPVWLHVFSVYFIHEFLQQSLRWKEQRRMIVSRTFQFFFFNFKAVPRNNIGKNWNRCKVVKH